MAGMDDGESNLWKTMLDVVCCEPQHKDAMGSAPSVASSIAFRIIPKVVTYSIDLDG